MEFGKGARGLALAVAVSVSPAAMAGEGGLEAQLVQIAPRVIQWAQVQAGQALRAGVPLSAEQVALARRVGVASPERIRVVLVEEIPLPDEPALKAASAQVGLSQSSAAGLTLGYAVIVRRGFERDARLLSHEFRHVAQYEAQGGIERFLEQHLRHLVRFGYEDSPFERDARAHEAGDS
jgi:hypothetical protein